MSGYCAATSRTHSRNSPSLIFMMFALCTAVTRLRPWRRAYSKANCAMRVDASLGDDLQALDHAGHDLVLEAGVEILGVLAHDDEIDALVAGRHDGMFQTGRRFANRSSALRRPTFTLVKPPPTGVVTGPLSATLFRLIESSSSAGSVEPCCSSAPHAGQVRLPLDVEAGGLEDLDDGGGDFRADAVAGDQRDACLATRGPLDSRASQ